MLPRELGNTKPPDPRRHCHPVAVPVGIVTLGFLGVAGFFLFTGHTAHVFGALPWLSEAPGGSRKGFVE
jgi:hypothetical protein